MINTRKIAKNTIVYFVSQIIVYLLGFFITMYTARYLGSENFGILSLAISLSGIFVIFVELGLGPLTTREVARNTSKTNKYLVNLIIIKIILVFLMLGLVILSTFLLNYSDIVREVIYILSLSVAMGAFVSIFSSIFQAYEKIEYISAGVFLGTVVVLFGVLIGVYYQFNIIFFAFVYAISNIVVLFYFIIFYIKIFSFPKFEVDFSFWKPNIKEAVPYGITSCSVSFYTYIDSIILSVFQGITVVGWYSAAYKLMLALFFIPTAVNMAIFPVMSRFYSSKDSLQLINYKYFKYMVLISIPIGFGTTILADQIILLIFGQEYTQSIIALQILIWAMVITFLGSPFSTLIQSINKQLIVTKVTIIGTIINIILNLLLIPQFSYIGSCFAMIITEVILQFYIYYASYKLGYGICGRKAIEIFFKSLISSFIMIVFILSFKNVNLILLIVLATIIYFSALYLIKGIDDEDLSIIKSILNFN